MAAHRLSRIGAGLLLGLLSISACDGCSLATSTSFPVVYRRDTHRVASIWLDKTVVRTFRSHYDAAQAEGLEAALCVYGRLRADTLRIEYVVEPDYMFRQPQHVGYNCPPAPDFLGRLHTHLRFPGQGAVTLPSYLDRLNFWGHADEVLLLVSVGYQEAEEYRVFGVFWALRDGREGWFQWPAQAIQ